MVQEAAAGWGQVDRNAQRRSGTQARRAEAAAAWAAGAIAPWKAGGNRGGGIIAGEDLSARAYVTKREGALTDLLQALSPSPSKAPGRGRDRIRML